MCDKTCIFCFLPIINKYLFMGGNVLYFPNVLHINKGQYSGKERPFEIEQPSIWRYSIMETDVSNILKKVIGVAEHLMEPQCIFANVE